MHIVKTVCLYCALSVPPYCRDRLFGARNHTSLFPLHHLLNSFYAVYANWQNKFGTNEKGRALETAYHPVHSHLPLPPVAAGHGVQDEAGGERERRQYHERHGQHRRGQARHVAGVQALGDNGHTGHQPQHGQDDGDWKITSIQEKQ